MNFSIIASFSALAASQANLSEVSMIRHPDRVEIVIGSRPFASYFHSHPDVARPFYSQVTTPAGVSVTRTFPPIAGKDRTDHPTMHPGVWLAFGDISGADFWRNKGPRVVHEKFLAGPANGMFRTANRYEANGRVIVREQANHQVVVKPNRTLLILESTFTTDDPDGIAFGDQEEMGLGVRLATPLTVGNGGRMTNPSGDQDEKGLRGKSAAWCDARNGSAGVLVMSQGTIRDPWWHVRDYGLIVANPFGRRALTKGAPSSVIVNPDQPLTLRFAVLVYDGTIDPKSEYEEYSARVGKVR